MNYVDRVYNVNVTFVLWNRFNRLWGTMGEQGGELDMEKEEQKHEEEILKYNVYIPFFCIPVSLCMSVKLLCMKRFFFSKITFNYGVWGYSNNICSSLRGGILASVYCVCSLNHTNKSIAVRTLPFSNVSISVNISCLNLLAIFKGGQYDSHQYSYYVYNRKKSVSLETEQLFF